VSKTQTQIDARARMRSLTAALVVLAACAAPEPAPDEIVEVGKPPELERLDATVREQFEALWRNLHRRVPGAGEAPDPGAAWGALGQWFDVYGYPDSAGRCYRNARRLKPAEPRWPYYLGLLAEGAGDLDAAEAYFSAAAGLAPDVVAPRIRLGDLALRRQEPDRAEVFYREVLAGHPESPGALLGKGRLALLRGDPAAALEPLETLSALQPEAVEVRYSLGLAWRRLGDEERSADHLRRVPEDNVDQLSLVLDDPWERELRSLDRGARNLTRRGVRAFRRGEHERAAVLLGLAVGADPDGPETRINYALALRETGRWAAAQEQLGEALRQSGEGSEMAAKAHLQLGRLLAARGRPAAAVAHLEAALAIDPRSVVAHLELGRLHHNQGRLEAALAHYAAVRTVDRPLAATRFWHAALLILLDRRQAALESLAEDLRELGDERRLRLLMARLLAAAPEATFRDVARARELLAVQAAPPDVLFAETAAMVAAEDGRFAAAVAWQRAAVDALAGVRPRTAAHTARRRLVLYERGEPCRDPWEARETPILVRVTQP